MTGLPQPTWRVLVLLGVALMLSACAPPPMFGEAPAVRYGITVPASAAGLWAKEGKDEGSRVRIVQTGSNTLRLEIFNTKFLAVVRCSCGVAWWGLHQGVVEFSQDSLCLRRLG